MRAVVAAGHHLTCEAASLMLKEGGNAFDAAVAAGFASTVVEPTLSSLGGGGFMLAYKRVEGKEKLFDFFVNTSGKGRNGEIEPHFFPITVNFRDSLQDFHIGMGSVAVPGVIKGLLHIHDKLCTLPLKKILEPAIRYARDGVVLNESQAYFLHLLEPIITLSDTGKSIY
ncbi:MAG: gamma-glutamyltransferase, partial [Nitrospirae bacterium]